ncbi:MAG: hypothetical protein EPO52_04075 [Herbiconiux sp.]|uniref:hypothetical protein n=1 Tax=Herbiconiux sp. TaxID=1871186 RepID=UPI0012033F82|nr:hypothetical protein [Herbiconiux sp.]TAJ49455.1 MAG: hypothetical protein EPO52_04075 [Herbiconiux sp.]
MRRFRTEGDNPNEYWAVCDDCDGTGSVNVVVLNDDESFNELITEAGTCPACDGVSFIEAEADDFD